MNAAASTQRIEMVNVQNTKIRGIFGEKVLTRQTLPKSLKLSKDMQPSSLKITGWCSQNPSSSKLVKEVTTLFIQCFSSIQGEEHEQLLASIAEGRSGDGRDWSGNHVVVLQEESELISAAVFMVSTSQNHLKRKSQSSVSASDSGTVEYPRNQYLVEIPLIATAPKYRRRGYCKLMVRSIIVCRPYYCTLIDVNVCLFLQIKIVHYITRMLAPRTVVINAQQHNVAQVWRGSSLQCKDLVAVGRVRSLALLSCHYASLSVSDDGLGAMVYLGVSWYTSTKDSRDRISMQRGVRSCRRNGGRLDGPN